MNATPPSDTLPAVPRGTIPIHPAPAESPGDSSVELISMYAAQKKIHPRSVTGWFAAWRWVMVWLTQLLFYGLPWLTWNGRPAVLFDLSVRRFYILDLVLYPQDFIYLTALLVISAYSLFLFTAVAGRLWCGFACPQTVYTEIYLWVERQFEGDRAARMKLDAGPWTLNKLWRKAGKQLTWALIGLWTGFTLVGYFTPIRVLWSEALSLGLGPWEWFWVLFYGFATYGNAGYMREQVCKYMCPYARFQSAMFDKDTMIVSYDAERGEPRGSRPKSLGHAGLAAAGKGECVDCQLCVHVCPTGIDIRNGLQYECISCTSCIDVCDGVMDKMGYPRGLVRFATQNGLAQHWTRGQLLRRVLRPRVLIYTAVLLAICTALAVSIAMRSPFRVDVIRDRGALAREVGNGNIENVYRLQLMNASEQVQTYRVAVRGLEQAELTTPATLQVAPTQAGWLAVNVQLPQAQVQRLGPGVYKMQFEIRREGDGPDGPVTLEKSTFVVPK